jgi:hypothetical protein
MVLNRDSCDNKNKVRNVCEATASQQLDVVLANALTKFHAAAMEFLRVYRLVHQREVEGPLTKESFQ